MLFGAPLGVCVNCATPIAQGLYAAGARLETALATLISSPTLNIIVISMSFTLLPWPIATASVIGVFLLLLLLPLCVAKFATANIGGTAHSTNVRLKPPVPSMLYEAEAWGDATITVLTDFSKNLLFIIKAALPLMLLAGALGAAVIEVVPLQKLADLSASPLNLILVVLLAVVLPVPMAFNVVIVMVLLSAGLAPGFGAVLLFGLAVFSVYPAAIIARQISVSLSIALVVLAVTVAASLGAATNLFFEHSQKAQKLQVLEATQARSQKVLSRVAAICDQSPETAERCFGSQLRRLDDLLPDTPVCDTRPSGMSLQNCLRNLKLVRALASSARGGTLQPCFNLEPSEGRNSCLQTAALELALSQRDDAFCRRLDDPASVRQCQIEYLNANLLFNPDVTACQHLSGQDYELCATNVRIYQIADTENMQACDEFSDSGARKQCRWITATSLVGKRNDTSGCEILEPTLKQRCTEQALGWAAERSRNSAPCGEISSNDLRDLCLLKVSNAQVSYELSALALAEPVNDDFQFSENGPKSVAEADYQDDLPREVVSKASGVTLERTAYRPSTHTGEFLRREMQEVGVSKVWRFRGTDLFEPFIIGKGVASGDFNNDQWPDLVLATERGVALYRNVGAHFRLVNLEQGALKEKNVFVVALVDMDGDGNQDIFATTYGGKNYLVLNQSGDFSESRLIEFSGADRLLTISAGFGDLDADGDVDVVFGNWSSGAEKLFSPEYSANEILLRGTEEYEVVSMGDIRGETNSVLITDLNGDQMADLVFGNDRLVPDFFYLREKDGKFAPLPKDSLVPLSSMYTMSLEAADFNNDLRQDIFSTDMSFSRQATSDYCSQIKAAEDMSVCEAWLDVLTELKDINVAVCQKTADVTSCVDAMTIQAAKSLKDGSLCDKVSSSSSARRLCQHLAEVAAPEAALDTSLHIEQRQQNTLLLAHSDGYVESAKKLGIDSSYWSWHAGAADLDNDGWNDVYVGNGFHFGDGFYEVQPNRMFQNNQGAGFTDVAESWGLNDRINTPTYTYLDYDLDGDLDIFATGVIEGPRLFENRLNDNRSISFELQQGTQNTDAIGASVTIKYGEQAQLKEISMSGGFMSFDNPVAYFGLGEVAQVEQVLIRWPDGELTEISMPLSAGFHYSITREF